jgi:four helix bundle protein
VDQESNSYILEYPEHELFQFFVKEEIPFSAGFERLWVWQKAYKLMQAIHKFSMTLPSDEKYRMRDQVERSFSSVCDNIAEGYSSYYYNDKIECFNTARKEAGETQNHIRKLAGKEYVTADGAQEWIKEYEEVIRGINGFVRYVRSKKRK